ncbi:MAG: hypothetical protein ACKO7Z_06765 [Cyanobacteriota bacterium]
MSRSVLRRSLAGLVVAAAVGALPAAQAFDAGRVNAFCLAGFNTAMAAAGKTPAAGMAEYTCNCFSNRLQQGQSIDQARQACVSLASQQFPVP